VVRFFLSLAAGLGTALVVAMALVVLDLYLTGHALGTISGPLLDWPALGVHLSLADILMLAAAALAAAVTWRRLRPRPP
jgi:uncharacterized membrane protein YkgB